MQFVARRFVVPVVNELAGVVIDPVGPVSIFACGKQNHKDLVLPSACEPETSHVTTTWEQV
jgi:hypothetical protein